MADISHTKRVIYLVIGVVVAGALGFLLYRFFAPAPPTKEAPGERITGRLPGVARPGVPGEELREEEGRREEIVGRPEERLLKLTDFSVVSPALNKNGTRVLFYKKDGGDLFAYSLNGEIKEKISNITIVGLVEAQWSLQESAAVFYLDRETIKGFLHLSTTSVASLPQDIRGFSFSPDGKSLAYLLPREDRLNLVIADSQGRGAKTVFSTPVLDAGIKWVSADRIAFATAPSGLAEGFLFLYSRSAGTFNKILGPVFGMTPLWSPDGSRVLVSSTNSAGRGLALSIHDLNGASLFSVTLGALAEKCVFADSKKIYCAVPRSVPATAVLPDDYLRGELNTSDRLVSLDLEKKEVKEVFNEGDFDMANLLVTQDESNLFFVNRADGTLWALKLK